MLFNKPKNDSPSLEDQIKVVLTRMSTFDAEDPEFDQLIGQLERLYKLKNHNPSGFKPSADAILSVTGSIIGILLITRHESLNVITSKAMSFIPKLK